MDTWDVYPDTLDFLSEALATSSNLGDGLGVLRRKILQ